jgi:succinoglycan biosynthesis protein ExoA
MNLAQEGIRTVTVMVPMLDEARFLPTFVSDLADQDYPGPVEFLFADGGSSDGSREILASAMDGRGLPCLVLENHDVTVSHGLNRCIEAASGDLLVRMDCHSRYPPDYLRLCVEAAEDTGAAVVGGVVVAEGSTPTERAVAYAMESPFGGIGWTRFGGSRSRHEVDTVTFGAFRREVFDAVGAYDVALVRNQDDELSFRIRQKGGTIVLDPKIRVYYRPRGSFPELASQYFEYGRWKLPIMRKHRAVVSGRSLAPPLLVLSLGALASVGTVSESARKLLALEALIYGTAVTLASLDALRGKRSEVGLLPRVAGAFSTFHLSYGAGFLASMVRPPSTPEVRYRSRGSHLTTPT